MTRIYHNAMITNDDYKDAKIETDCPGAVDETAMDEDGEDGKHQHGHTK